MGASQSKQQLESENVTIDIFHGHEYKKKISLPLIPTPVIGPNTFAIDTTGLDKLTKVPRKAMAKELRKKFPRDAEDIMKTVDKYLKNYPASLSTPFFRHHGALHPAIMPALTFASIAVAGALTYSHISTRKVQNEIALAKVQSEIALAEVQSEIAPIRVQSEISLANTDVERGQ